MRVDLCWVCLSDIAETQTAAASREKKTWKHERAKSQDTSPVSMGHTERAVERHEPEFSAGRVLCCWCGRSVSADAAEWRHSGRDFCKQDCVRSAGSHQRFGCVPRSALSSTTNPDQPLHVPRMGAKTKLVQNQGEFVLLNSVQWWIQTCFYHVSSLQAWALAIRLLRGRSPFSTFQFQRMLPRQPLPDLNKTLDRLNSNSDVIIPVGHCVFFAGGWVSRRFCSTQTTLKCRKTSSKSSEWAMGPRSKTTSSRSECLSFAAFFVETPVAPAINVHQPRVVM